MKNFVLYAFVVAAAAHTAQAKPFGGADCVATSQDNLQGETLAVMHNASPFDVSSALNFAPASFYVADGYAVKIFSEPKFKGQSALVGTPDQIAFNAGRAEPSISSTEGGHLFNVKAGSWGYYNFTGKVASFACVPAGKMWKNTQTFKTWEGPALYFNGQKFATDGHQYHGLYATLTVGEVDGKKLLHLTTSYYKYPSADITVDLDSGLITVVRHAADYPQPYLSTQTVLPDLAVNGVDFKYAGAVRMILDVIKEIRDNAPGYGPSGNQETIPNLELDTLVRLLGARASGL